MTSNGATRPSAIQAVGLTKLYGRGERAVHALGGVDLTIEAGEFVSVVGRSGSGKTTLLDCLGLLMRPTEGRLLIDGEDAGGLGDGRRAEVRGRRIGFIFQEFNLLPSLTAMENILLPLRYTGGDRVAAARRAEALLATFELSDRAHHRPTELSGGESQRVAIVRALINQPALVLGDEPTGELDTETAASLIELLRRINRDNGVTFVIVTHDLELASRTDRIVRLRDGRVISDERTPVALA